VFSIALLGTNTLNFTFFVSFAIYVRWRKKLLELKICISGVFEHKTLSVKTFSPESADSGLLSYCIHFHRSDSTDTNCLKQSLGQERRRLIWEHMRKIRVLATVILIVERTRLGKRANTTTLYQSWLAGRSHTLKIWGTCVQIQETSMRSTIECIMTWLCRLKLRKRGRVVLLDMLEG